MMENKPILLSLFLTLCVAATFTLAQGTALTYQARLHDNGTPADGLYDLKFTLYDDVSNGTPQSVTLTNAAVAVSNGLFTVTLDFGAGVFDGTALWLEIGTTTNGGGLFTKLSPRQPINSTPYAITAANLNGVVPPSSLSGTYSEILHLTNEANQVRAMFEGDGSGLTGIHTLEAEDGSPAEAVFVDADGKVGVGTPTPQTTLDVAGSIFSRGATGGHISAFNPSNQLAGVTLGWLDNTARIRIGGSGGVVSGAQNGLDVQTVGDASLMRIKGDGKVGIGTASPEAEVANTGLRVANAGHVIVDNNYGFFSVNDSSDGIGAGVDTTTSDDLVLYAGGGSKMHVGADGNVGIGITSPSAPLHVNAPSGDGAVILPVDSISATEMLNEMGVAQRWRDDYIQLDPGDPFTTLLSRTISCPSDGFIIAFAAVTVYPPNVSVENYSVCMLTVTQDPDTSNWGGQVADPLRFRVRLVPGHSENIMFQRVFQVTAGANTVFFGGQSIDSVDGILQIDSPNLTLLFVPTSYGTVDLTPTP